jgi:glycosyltransferase involved in cell wall biosynthesis
MSTAPLVSILIPAFNAERWIDQTLDAALTQTWPATEIVVVDDGSTDRTAALVEQRLRGARGNLRLLRQSNRGQSAAQNRAVRESRGAFIQYLDADDVISADKIARQMARIADEPGCIASAEWARFYRTPAEASFRPEPVWRDLDPVDWLVAAWTGGGPMMQPGIWLIPRDLIERAGPWNERLTLINDFEYFTRVLLASRGVRFTPGARLYYRSGNPSSVASLRSPEAWQSAIDSLDRGTRALLEREDSARVRRACADLFQVLAYDAYLENAAVSRSAEDRVAAFGGSRQPMGGGLLFRALERALGWKRAKRVKRLAYRIGYGRVARAKAHLSPHATVHAA